jgi:hypothetical protein
VLGGVTETGTSGADGPEDPPPQAANVIITTISAIGRKQDVIVSCRRTAFLSNCIVSPPFDLFGLTVLVPTDVSNLAKLSYKLHPSISLVIPFIE